MDEGLQGLVLRLQGKDILSFKYYINSILEVLEVIMIIGNKVMMM
jgi:hypothetical protein